jgi:hypothetical protein
METSDFAFEIFEKLGPLSESTKTGWTKELNLVSWNEREPKFDIREWSPDHLRMGKGVTLTREEAASLAVLLSARLRKA